MQNTSDIPSFLFESANIIAKENAKEAKENLVESKSACKEESKAISKNLIIIGYSLYKILSEETLNKRNLEQCFLDFKTASEFTDRFSSFWVKYIDLQIKRYENILSNFDDFQNDPNFKIYVRSEYSYWMTYADYKKYREDTRNQALESEVINHLKLWAIVRWLIELFSGIDGRIRSYIFHQADLISNCLFKVAKGNSITEAEAKIKSLTILFEHASKYFSEEEVAFLKNKQKVLDEECNKLKSAITDYKQSLSSQGIRLEILHSLELQNDINKMYSAIFYCCGLLNISIQDKNIKSLILEIREKANLLKMVQNLDDKFFWVYSASSCAVISSRDSLEKIVQNNALLDDSCLKALLPVISYDLNDKLTQLETLLSNDKVICAENILKGIEARNRAVKESANIFEIKLVEDSKVYSETRSNSEVVAFKSMLHLRRFVTSLAGAEISANQDTIAQQPIDSKVDSTRFLRDIVTEQETIEEAHRNLSTQFLQVNQDINRQAESLERLNSSISNLSSEIDRTKKEFSEKLAAEVKGELNRFLFMNSGNAGADNGMIVADSVDQELSNQFVS